MAGPFPGMDPYLEHPVLWPGVHQRIISITCSMLNNILPADYVADVGERVYVMQPNRSIYPDIVVFEQPAPSPVRADGRQAAVATVDPPWLITIEPVEVREVFIQVMPVGEEHRVVSVIEVLSYANKAPGSEGRNLYLTKQQELVHSAVNLIEIDLLREGENTIAAHREQMERQGRWDYVVCLHRAAHRNRFEAWTTTVRDRLPRFAVPLEKGLPDVAVDLQEVFDRNYEEGAYARRINYRNEPPAPLDRVDAVWADRLLRAKGLRKEPDA